MISDSRFLDKLWHFMYLVDIKDVTVDNMNYEKDYDVFFF